MSYGSMMDAGNLWWSEIAGPAKLVTDIEGALSKGQSVICNVTTSLSFRWTFRDIIGHWLFERGIMVVHVDCHGEYNGEDITEFLLRQLQPNLLTEYQRRRTPQYMRDKGVLHGKLLWIRGVDSSFQRNWIQYISSYRSHDLEHGLLLMEVQSSPSVRLPQNLQYFDHNQYIRKDDLRLYASIVAENHVAASGGAKQYAVELVTALTFLDSELANDILLQAELFTEEPLTLLRRIKSDYYSDSPRGQEDWHPFYLLLKEREDELIYRIWSAQVRVGYPRIELERRELIRRWHNEIEEALNVAYLDERTGSAKRFTDYEGNLITDPRDIEVGMLLKLCASRQFTDPSQYLLYLPDQSERNRIRLLRDCRNNLAHLDVCGADDFFELVNAE